MHDETHRRAGPDGDRGLDLQIARGQLVARARNVLLGRFADGLDQVAFAGEGEVRADGSIRGWPGPGRFRR